MEDVVRTIAAILPQPISEWLLEFESIIELVLDVGREPKLRVSLDNSETHRMEGVRITKGDLKLILSQPAVTCPNDSNRSGIAGTLCRISLIFNREKEPIGMTIRAGKPLYGIADNYRHILQSGSSVLFVGKPGVGKTSILREACRLLSTDYDRRVVIVDTSNEIAGDGDTPHYSVGESRRLMVGAKREQARVMIEAVENHMPETIVIDEVSTALEVAACRTISERGVQLVATVHGDSLLNVLHNPPLAGLLGGVQTVTLSDEQAKKRGCKKTVRERESAPSFDYVVVVKSFDDAIEYSHIDQVIDALLENEYAEKDAIQLPNTGSHPL